MSELKSNACATRSTEAQADAAVRDEVFDTIPIGDIPANVRVCEQNIRLNGWMLGGLLQSAKKRLPHGGFMDWLKTHTDLSQTTANDLMNLYDGVRQTPFLADMRQSAALALLALAPDDRKRFAEGHDLDGMSVRDLRSEIERVKREVSEKNEALKTAQSERETAVAQARREAAAEQTGLAEKAMTDARNAQHEVERLSGMYEKASELYEEAQKRVDDLERALSEAPPPVLTPVEIEKEVVVPPPDYEEMKAELKRATDYAERMERSAKDAQDELRRQTAKESGERGISGLRRATMAFLGQAALFTGGGYAPGSAREYTETLDCVKAVESWCAEARAALTRAPIEAESSLCEDGGTPAYAVAE